MYDILLIAALLFDFAIVQIIYLIAAAKIKKLYDLRWYVVILNNIYQLLFKCGFGRGLETVWSFITTGVPNEDFWPLIIMLAVSNFILLFGFFLLSDTYKSEKE